MELGRKLAAARMKSGLTQEEAADALGISRQTLSNWENDKSRPDISQAQLLAEVYSVRLDVLLGTEHTSEEVVISGEAETVVVEGTRLYERLVLTSYLSVYLLMILCFYSGAVFGNSWALFFGIVFNGLGLYILTGVASLDVGLLNCWRKYRLQTVVLFGLGHMLFPFMTYRLAHFLSSSHFTFPDYREIIGGLSAGLLISVIMLAAGRLISWFIEKLDKLTEKFDPIS